MEIIYEYCKNNGYSLSLTNYIIELFLSFSAKASTKDSQNFVKALLSTKVVLVDSLEGFVRIINDYTKEKIEYEMSSSEKLMMIYSFRQKGIYLPLPNLETKNISRLIVARVSKENEITSEEDKTTLSHEIFHLLRSYGDNEFEYINETLHSKSGVITTLIPLQNGKIDYPNSRKENVQSEENFVNFLGRKYSTLFQIDSIDNVFESLKEKIGNGEVFLNLSSDEKNEILTLYLNLLLIVRVYNGNITSSLNSSNADFLKIIEDSYGKESALLFHNIYSRPFQTDESVLQDVEKVFASHKLV